MTSNATDPFILGLEFQLVYYNPLSNFKEYQMLKEIIL